MFTSKAEKNNLCLHFFSFVFVFVVFQNMRSIVVLIFFVSCANCYKILGVFPCPSKSHYHLGHALMKGLADDGHEVTIVSPYSQKEPIKNYKEILLENSVAEFEKCRLDKIALHFNSAHAHVFLNDSVFSI